MASLRPLFLSALAAALLLASPASALDTLIPKAAVWKFLDDGSDQGTAWTALAFDDTNWDAGPAQLGYGEDDEATLVGYGPDPGDKFITTYFRHTFDVVDPGAYVTAVIRIVRDDGAVIHLNGTEVARINMPAGAIDASTLASKNVLEAAESAFLTKGLDPALLQAGTNVLAVEIHQWSGVTSDLSFDLELLADAHEILLRGPYLQQRSDTSVTVRWRTNIPASGGVWYGTDPGQLTLFEGDLGPSTDHEITVTGLLPDTLYYYAVGWGPVVLAGGDADHSMRTAPAPGARRAMRIWALGDSGTANNDVRVVRDAYVGFTGGQTTDFMLMLGDNAYPTGSDGQYQAAVFDTFPDFLRNTVVWSTRGNHETNLGVYHDVFSMPTNGEAGGIGSGTESYYSFDQGNVHFICLDSQGSDRDVGGPMWTWAETDISMTNQDWIIAFWHHPPYSKGSHDSDAEARLIDMRENFVPLLESWGVDLVLSGHSHSYERSWLIDRHYADSATFLESMKLDRGDGDPAGDGAYSKAAGPNGGTVYCVAGCSGKVTMAPLDHPAMSHSVAVLGSLILEIDGLRLDATFLDGTGAVEDRFTILQGATDPWTDLGSGLAGTQGVPQLRGAGAMLPGENVKLTLTDGLPLGSATLVLGFSAIHAPFKKGVLVPAPDLLIPGLPLDGSGTLILPFMWPSNLPGGVGTWWQFWIPDPAGPAGYAASNAISGLTP